MAAKTLTPRAFWLFFVLFVAIGAVLGGLGVMVYRSEIQTITRTAADQERYAVTLMDQVIGGVLDGIASDLLFLANQNELSALLRGDDGARPALAAEYLAFAAQKRIYDQIRFLDAQGQEQVRVNSNAGSPTIVPEAQLQDKRRRYYFRDVIGLQPGEVFVSPFDLNIEHGELERPFKPMIRFGTPVADTHGRKRGIVLLNYLGADLLQRVVEAAATAPGEAMLLNAESYWLLAPQAEDAWGFMLTDGHDISFANRYPRAWRHIRAEGSGQVRTPAGLFTFTTVSPLDEDFRSSTGAGGAYAPSGAKLSADDYKWVLLSHLPGATLAAITREIRLRAFVLGGSAFAVISVGAWFLALAIVRRRHYQEQIKAMAHYDSLTGLPNRALFFDRLEFVHRNAERYQRSYAVLYLDLDGFKEINDRYGHNAGDALLQEVAARLKKSVRSSDTVARLGGDELAVVLSESCDLAQTEILARKLATKIAEPIRLSAGEVRIGVSIGAAVFPDHGDTGEAVLHRADRAMYLAKDEGGGVRLASPRTVFPNHGHL